MRFAWLRLVVFRRVSLCRLSAHAAASLTVLGNALPSRLAVLQVQKLKGFAAKQNASLKALERERAALDAPPRRFEVRASHTAPAAAAVGETLSACIVP
jgi:hypothetical protein